MRIVFVHTAEKVKRDSKGGLYTDGAYDHKVWSRYLKICDSFVFVARLDSKEYSDKDLSDKFNVIDASKIEVVLIQDVLSSIKNFVNIKLRLKNKIIFKTQIANSDKVIIRMPCAEGGMAAKLAKKYGKAYLVECVGCAWDSLWNYSLKGKILALPSFLSMRNSIINASSVLYVSNCFLQNRYPTKASSIGCSDVFLKDYDDAILKKKLDFINIKKDMIVLGTIANVEVSYKGHDDVIRAIAKLKKLGYKSKYLMAGAGDKSRLEKIAKKFDVIDSVEFVGSLPHSQIFEWLDNLDIYIQPSKLEGMPRALIEAMSRGCACIGTKVGGIPELLDDAYLYKRGNINQLANKIIYLKNAKSAAKASKNNFVKSKEFDNKKLENKRNIFYKKFISSKYVTVPLRDKLISLFKLLFQNYKLKYLAPYIYLLLANSLFLILYRFIIDQKLALRLFALTGVITLAFTIYRIYKIRKNVLDYNIIFLVLIFLFGNGQVFLYMIGIDTSLLNVFQVSGIESIVGAEMFFSFSLIFYSFGATLCLKSPTFVSAKRENDKKYLNALTIVSLSMIVISIIPYFQNLFSLLYTSINFGYEEIYNKALSGTSALENIISFITKFFIPGVIIFIYTKKDNKKIVYSGVLLLILIALIYMVIGLRGDAIMIIVALIVFCHNFIKKFNKKDCLKLFVLASIIMIIIPTIYAFRNTSEKSINGFLSSFKSAVVAKNPIVSTIAELGYSMHSFILTEDAVPSGKPYGLGVSYLSSVMMIVPSLFTGGFSFAKYAALDTWLQDYYKMTYGPGFSIFAEAYYNFGWIFGCLFILMLGLMFSKAFTLTIKNKQQNEILGLFILIFFYSNMLLARMPMHSTIRNALYLCVIPYIAILFIAKDGPQKLKNKLLSLVGR